MRESDKNALGFLFLCFCVWLLLTVINMSYISLFVDGNWIYFVSMVGAAIVFAIVIRFFTLMFNSLRNNLDSSRLKKAPFLWIVEHGKKSSIVVKKVYSSAGTLLVEALHPNLERALEGKLMETILVNAKEVKLPTERESQSYRSTCLIHVSELHKDQVEVEQYILKTKERMAELEIIKAQAEKACLPESTLQQLQDENLTMIKQLEEANALIKDTQSLICELLANLKVMEFTSTSNQSIASESRFQEIKERKANLYEIMIAYAELTKLAQ